MHDVIRRSSISMISSGASDDNHFQSSTTNILLSVQILNQAISSHRLVCTVGFLKPGKSQRLSRLFRASAYPAEAMITLLILLYISG